MGRTKGIIQVRPSTSDGSTVRVAIQLWANGIIARSTSASSQQWTTFDNMGFGSYRVVVIPATGSGFNRAEVSSSINETSFQDNVTANLTASGQSAQVPRPVPTPTPTPTPTPVWHPPMIIPTPTPTPTSKTYTLEANIMALSSFAQSITIPIASSALRLALSSTGWELGNMTLSGSKLMINFQKNGSITIVALITLIVKVLAVLGITFTAYKFWEVGQTAKITESNNGILNGLLLALANGDITQEQFDTLTGLINPVPPPSPVSDTFGEIKDVVLYMILGSFALQMFKK